jgi:hypothetical protein
MDPNAHTAESDFTVAWTIMHALRVVHAPAFDPSASVLHAMHTSPITNHLLSFHLVFASSNGKLL